MSKVEEGNLRAGDRVLLFSSHLQAHLTFKHVLSGPPVPDLQPDLDSTRGCRGHVHRCVFTVTGPSHCEPGTPLHYGSSVTLTHKASTWDIPGPDGAASMMMQPGRGSRALDGDLVLTTHTVRFCVPTDRLSVLSLCGTSDFEVRLFTSVVDVPAQRPLELGDVVVIRNQGSSKRQVIEVSDAAQPSTATRCVQLSSRESANCLFHLEHAQHASGGTVQAGTPLVLTSVVTGEVLRSAHPVARTEQHLYTSGKSGPLHGGLYADHPVPTLDKRLIGKHVVQVAIGSTVQLYLTDMGEVYASGSPFAPSMHEVVRIAGAGPTSEPMRTVSTAQVTNQAPYVCAAIGAKDGGLYMWGDPQGTLCKGHLKPHTMQCLLPDKELESVDVGSQCCAAVSKTGRVWARWEGHSDFKVVDGLKSFTIKAVSVAGPRRQRGKKTGDEQAHVLALDSDGRVYSWGGNSKGQLGQGDLTGLDQPTLIKALVAQRIVAIDAGKQISACVTNKGEVYMFGLNDNGQLGINAAKTAQTANPVQASGLDGVKVIDVSCGNTSTAVVTEDGSVYSCGSGSHFRTGHGTEDKLVKFTKVERFASEKVTSVEMGVYSMAVLATANNDSTVGVLNEQTILSILDPSAPELSTETPFHLHPWCPDRTDRNPALRSFGPAYLHCTSHDSWHHSDIEETDDLAMPSSSGSVPLESNSRGVVLRPNQPPFEMKTFQPARPTLTLKRVPFRSALMKSVSSLLKAREDMQAAFRDCNGEADESDNSSLLRIVALSKWAKQKCEQPTPPRVWQSASALAGDLGFIELALTMIASIHCAENSDAMLTSQALLDLINAMLRSHADNIPRLLLSPLLPALITKHSDLLESVCSAILVALTELSEVPFPLRRSILDQEPFTKGLLALMLNRKLSNMTKSDSIIIECLAAACSAAAAVSDTDDPSLLQKTICGAAFEKNTLGLPSPDAVLKMPPPAETQAQNFRKAFFQLVASVCLGRNKETQAIVQKLLSCPQILTALLEPGVEDVTKASLCNALYCCYLDVVPLEPFDLGIDLTAGTSTEQEDIDILVDCIQASVGSLSGDFMALPALPSKITRGLPYRVPKVMPALLDIAENAESDRRLVGYSYRCLRLLFAAGCETSSESVQRALSAAYDTVTGMSAGTNTLEEGDINLCLTESCFLLSRLCAMHGFVGAVTITGRFQMALNATSPEWEKLVENKGSSEFLFWKQTSDDPAADVLEQKKRLTTSLLSKGLKSSDATLRDAGMLLLMQVLVTIPRRLDLLATELNDQLVRKEQPVSLVTPAEEDPVWLMFVKTLKQNLIPFTSENETVKPLFDFSQKSVAQWNLLNADTVANDTNTCLKPFMWVGEVVDKEIQQILSDTFAKPGGGFVPFVHFARRQASARNPAATVSTLVMFSDMLAGLKGVPGQAQTRLSMCARGLSAAMRDACLADFGDPVINLWVAGAALQAYSSLLRGSLRQGNADSDGCNPVIQDAIFQDVLEDGEKLLAFLHSLLRRVASEFHSGNLSSPNWSITMQVVMFLQLLIHGRHSREQECIIQSRLAQSGIVPDLVRTLECVTLHGPIDPMWNHLAASIARLLCKLCSCRNSGVQATLLTAGLCQVTSRTLFRWRSSWVNLLQQRFDRTDHAGSVILYLKGTQPPTPTDGQPHIVWHPAQSKFHLQAAYNTQTKHIVAFHFESNPSADDVSVWWSTAALPFIASFCTAGQSVWESSQRLHFSVVSAPAALLDAGASRLTEFKRMALEIDAKSMLESLEPYVFEACVANSGNAKDLMHIVRVAELVSALAHNSTGATTAVIDQQVVQWRSKRVGYEDSSLTISGALERKLGTVEVLSAYNASGHALSSGVIRTISFPMPSSFDTLKSFPLIVEELDRTTSDLNLIVSAQDSPEGTKGKIMERLVDFCSFVRRVERVRTGSDFLFWIMERRDSWIRMHTLAVMLINVFLMLIMHQDPAHPGQSTFDGAMGARTGNFELSNGTSGNSSTNNYSGINDTNNETWLTDVVAVVPAHVGSSTIMFLGILQLAMAIFVALAEIAIANSAAAMAQFEMMETYAEAIDIPDNAGELNAAFKNATNVDIEDLLDDMPDMEMPNNLKIQSFGSAFEGLSMSMPNIDLPDNLGELQAMGENMRDNAAATIASVDVPAVPAVPDLQAMKAAMSLDMPSVDTGALTDQLKAAVPSVDVAGNVNAISQTVRNIDLPDSLEEATGIDLPDDMNELKAAGQRLYDPSNFSFLAFLWDTKWWDVRGTAVYWTSLSAFSMFAFNSVDSVIYAALLVLDLCNTDFFRKVLLARRPGGFTAVHIIRVIAVGITIMWVQAVVIFRYYTLEVALGGNSIVSSGAAQDLDANTTVAFDEALSWQHLYDVFLITMGTTGSFRPLVWTENAVLGSPDLVGKMMMSFVFQIAISVIFVATISALMVDSVWHWRQRELREECSRRTTCPICSGQAAAFESAGSTLKAHVSEAHSVWQYAAFVTYLSANASSLNVAEQSMKTDTDDGRGTWLPWVCIART